MNAMESHITCVSIVCSTVSSGADKKKHQSSASLAFVRWIHHRPVKSPHKRPVTRKMFPFDNVIMQQPKPRNGKYTSELGTSMASSYQWAWIMWTVEAYVWIMSKIAWFPDSPVDFVLYIFKPKFTRALQWLVASLHYFQCVSTGDTTTLHQAIDL